MRIISKNHDYYDSVQGMGQDRSLIYLRNEKTLDSEEARKMGFGSFFQYSDERYGDSNGVEVSHHVVGFCGKIYPVIELSVIVPYSSNKKSVFCFKIEDVDEFVNAVFKPKYQKAYYYKTTKSGKDFKWGLYPLYREIYANLSVNTHFVRYRFETFFDNIMSRADKYSALFEKMECPTFLASSGPGYYGKKAVTINPELKRVEFFRAKDPYTAFQELNQYISNIAQPEKAMPVIPDNLKVETHGFDKYSFRKDKAK